MHRPLSRRAFIGAGSAGGLLLALPGLVLAQAAVGSGPLLPVQDLTPHIERITGGAALRAGKVALVLPSLAENGNSVPLTVRIASPMTAADHVRSLHLLAERNPRTQVATFYLSPEAGRAEINTRIRLAVTQRLVAVAALSDGSFWSGEAKVVVTSAACLDEALSGNTHAPE